MKTKTLILIIITLLVATPCLAGSGSVAITLSGTAGAAGGAGKVGTDSEQSQVVPVTSGSYWFTRIQASATGSLTNGHIYAGDTTNTTGVFAIYYSSSTTPVTASAADYLVASFASLSTGSSEGWKDKALGSSGTKTVTSGSWYWVGVYSDSGTPWPGSIGTAAVPIYGIASDFSTPPASLNGLTATELAATGFAPIAAYAN
jgi:hypothetical protein